MSDTETRLGELLDRLVEEHAVPGAVVGVFDGEQVSVAASGTANLNTGAPMRPDTAFLIGSVTKIWTTTLVMTLVDDGLLDLDAPVRDYLADLRPGPGLDETVTVRQLLNHTSGIDAADYLPDDLGRGDDAIAAYVGRVARFGQLYEPGALWSYNNAGFVVAGRLVEVVTREPFAVAFRERLIEPMRAQRTFLRTEDALLHGLAVGHVRDTATDSTVATRRFSFPDVLAPAGSTLTVSAKDALAFARVHLDRGVTADDVRVLSAGSTAAMAAHEIDLPVPALGSAGLGWRRSASADDVLLSHTGGSLGGQAQLVLAPRQGGALVAYANVGDSARFHDAVKSQVLEDVLDVRPPQPFAEPGPRVPASTFAGRYVRYGYELRVDADGEHLAIEITPTDDANAWLTGAKTTTLRCHVTGPRTFGFEGKPVGHLVDGGRFVFMGDRLLRRVDDR